MNANRIFYLCPVCFRAYDTCDESHVHRMIAVDAGAPGDERRKPLTDSSGHLTTRAPRWYLEAVGWVPERHAHAHRAS